MKLLLVISLYNVSKQKDRGYAFAFHVEVE